MKRVIVIGCPGSGKTTFAVKLHRITDLPLYHLDAIWHRPDKTNIPRAEFDRKLQEIFATDRWIIDGNYAGTLEQRLRECDTVFFFDLPTELCLQGVRERLGKRRHDLPWIEEAFDPEFEEFIQDFPKHTLPKLYELMEQYRGEKELHSFKSRAEGEEYLKALHGGCHENDPI